MVWPFSKRLHLPSWAAEQKIQQPIRPDLVHFVAQGDEESLRNFSRFCHELITDRDTSFTCEMRTGLYRRWLSSGQPVLMAIHASGVPVCASIIMPLTRSAYQAFWSAELDAPDIERRHIAPKRRSYRYLLVDVVARDKGTIKSLPPAQRADFIGLGVRALIYHSAAFFNPRRPPIVMCSTANRKLQLLLRGLGFEEGVGPRSSIPIYRADLARPDWYHRDVEEQYDRWRSLVTGYRSTLLGARAENVAASRCATGSL